MNTISRRSACLTGLAAVLAATLPARVLGQGVARPPGPNGAPVKPGEWPTYGGDLWSQRYSPLEQINAENFETLELAWRFQTSNLGPNPEVNLQTTPLMIGGVLYFTAGTRRAAVAADAATGELLWKFNLNEGRRRGPRPQSGRGLAWWADGSEERILYVTPGYQLVALDAKEGRPIAGFGQAGIVDLRRDLEVEVNLDTADIGLAAAPIVVGDVIVIGAAHSAGNDIKKSNVRGAVRGYDVRTGKRLWTFHTVPRKGEFGVDTWKDGAEEWAGNTGAWAQMSADPALGLVYVGVELPTNDWYGGNRPGAGLFGESVVALDVKTGERRWHYQTVHHGIWDRDIPCAPILADLTVNGKVVPALIQPTKQAWMYVLDRTNGEPVWPIPERPVPKGDVLGEWYAPTQPHPSKPPAFDVQGVTIADLIDYTPELRAEAEKLVANYRIGPLYTPAIMSKWPGPLASIVNPMGDGAAQWPGGALDPQTNIAYVFSSMSYNTLGMVPTPPGSEMPVTLGVERGPGQAPYLARPRLTVQGLPLLKPPYGRITALDMNKGEILWQRPHGETPDEIRNHPALKGRDIPQTGSQGKVGVLATKTLLIAGDGTATTDAKGQRGAWLRAYDKATGREVGKVRLGSRVTGSPMSYALNGRQYIAVAIAGPGFPAELVAYRLPTGAPPAAAGRAPVE